MRFWEPEDDNATETEHQSNVPTVKDFMRCQTNKNVDHVKTQFIY